MVRSPPPLRIWLLSILLALGFIFAPDYAVAAEPSSSGQKVRVRVTTPNDPDTINASTLRAVINNDATATRFIKPLDLNGQLFLPFKDFLQLFDFPIYADQTASRWRGFFINPDNQFSLDIDALDAQIKTTHYPVTRQDVRKKDGQLYISAKALESWFGISIRDVSYATGSIHFSTSFVSPSEAQALRKKNRLELLGPYTHKEPATSAFPEVPQTSFGLPPLAKADATTQKHSLSGTTHAGHEVELYHNDKLISFQYADETGRYNFQDIPLLLGENVFRIAIYGAQGQYEERKERITAEIPLVKNFKISPSITGKTESKEAISLKNTQNAMTVSTDAQPPPVQAKNWAELSVVQSGVVVGVLEAYIGIRGTFLRLDAFLRYMGIAYNQQTSSDVLEITADENRHISLDIEQRAYIENEKQHSLYDTDAFKDEGKIYANTSLLYRLFPHSAFVVNQTLRKIEVPEKSVKDTAPQPTVQTSRETDAAAAPEAAPIQPVIIDDLSGQQRLSGSTLPPKEAPESEDVLHIEQSDTAAAAAPTQEDSEQSKGEPLILQPQIKNLAPTTEFIEALDFPGQVFLPLNDLFQIIGFPIKFDDAKNEARGFFFAPENEFYLNVDKREVRAASKNMEITRRDVRKADGQIYISTDSFTEWFGIACEVDRGRGTLHLKTDKLFPVEENEERQKRWNKLLNVVTPTDENKPLLQNPYQAIDYPTVDVNIGADYTHNKTSTSNGNALASQYNLQGAMEIG
ncbi:MAG TPA: hypothetical protein DCY07_08920, partial [Rhodospirillaceae bacterium]|nr:hypothetical protein [Rhodospirillaceae bacterium]